MRKMIVYLLFGFLAMIVLLYILGWSDSIANNQLSGNILNDIQASFKDFFGVIKYFWFVIIIGSIVLGAIIYGIKTGIGKLIG